jgi:hypothetical protein
VDAEELAPEPKYRNRRCRRQPQGKRYRVMVLADGFAYGGKTFTSLSST